jgi:hypothetical protein
MKMIYSVLILVATVFIFFWVVQQHKKKQREYFATNQLSDLMKQFSNIKPTNEQRASMCVMAAASGKITKEECVKLLKDSGDAQGALKIFAKIGGFSF